MLFQRPLFVSLAAVGRGADAHEGVVSRGRRLQKGPQLGVAVPAQGVAPEDGEVDGHIRLPQESADLLLRHGQGFRLGIAEDACGDQGKGQGLEALGPGQGQGIAVAGAQGRFLARAAALPAGPYGVDDMAGRQAVTGGQLRFAGPASPKCATFLRKRRPRGGMDGPVHPAASHKAFVCGVDDGVHFHGGDVLPDQKQRHGASLLSAEIIHLPARRRKTGKKTPARETDPGPAPLLKGVVWS